MASKCKNDVRRKVYSVRLTPEAYEYLAQTADLLSVSVSDLIQNYADKFCRWRLESKYSPVYWN